MQERCDAVMRVFTHRCVLFYYGYDAGGVNHGNNDTPFKLIELNLSLLALLYH